MDFLSVLSKGSQRDKVRELCLFINRYLLYKVARQIGIVLAQKEGKFHKRKSLDQLLSPQSHKALYTNIVLQILWTFNFYDVNRDGCISRDEMMKVIPMTLT